MWIPLPGRRGGWRICWLRNCPAPDVRRMCLRWGTGPGMCWCRGADRRWCSAPILTPCRRICRRSVWDRMNRASRTVRMEVLKWTESSRTVRWKLWTALSKAGVHVMQKVRYSPCMRLARSLRPWDMTVSVCFSWRERRPVHSEPRLSMP